MERIRRNILATLMAASFCPLACAMQPAGEAATLGNAQASVRGTPLLARLLPPAPDAIVDAVASSQADDFNRQLDEVRRIALAGLPSFTSVSKELLEESVRRLVPALPADTDMDKVYVTVFRDAADGRQDIVSSRPLTELYREIILHPRTFPEFNQSETGFFDTAGTLASSARIPALAGGAMLAKIESALHTARDFRTHYRRRIDRYWNEALPAKRSAGDEEAPTRKAWLAQALAHLRQAEINSMIEEGWLDPVSDALVGMNDQVNGIEVLNGNFRNKLSIPPSVAISEKPCVNFPQDDCGKLLLLSAGLPTRLFDSADALRAWLLESAGPAAALRTQPVSGDPWRWLLDRVVAWGTSDAFAAMAMLESSPMAVAEASATVDRHGDLASELDQWQMVDAYNARLRLDLLMPDDVADATRERKVAWRAQTQAHLRELRAAGSLLAGQPDVRRGITSLARNTMAERLRARGAGVVDPDAISVFHWTYLQHHMSGKPRRWCDAEGLWHMVDENGTGYTGRKLTLTEAALENLPAAPGPLTRYDILDADGQPISGLSYDTIAAIVREADVAQRYLDTIGRFEGSVDIDAAAFGLGHGMMLNLLHEASRAASGLTPHAQNVILHALANPAGAARIAVHQVQVSGSSIGGGVLLFDTAGSGNDAYVLYTPGAPDNRAFRGFRGLDDMARTFRDDAALRSYLVEAVVSGERDQASRILARGGRGGDIVTVPIDGDFLAATVRAFFAQWRSESRHLSSSTSFRDQLTIADNVKGATDAFSFVLPLAGLVEGGLDMNGAIECFLAGDKGCYGKLAAAGLAIAMDALPLAAAPLRAPLRSMGRTFRRFASVTRGQGGNSHVRFALPAEISLRVPDPDMADVLRKFEVSGIDVATMHSPSRNLFRDGAGQEYVKIGDRVYRSRLLRKPDGGSERVIVDPGNAGNTRAIHFSREGWAVRPAPRLLGGSPRLSPIAWNEPRWGDGYLKGIDPISEGRRVQVAIDGYLTDVVFDLDVCRWRILGKRPGAYLEYDEVTRQWQVAALQPGANGAPALPPDRATDVERLHALHQFGISRDPVQWPAPVEGSRTHIPKVINQLWLGDAQGLRTRRTHGDSGDTLAEAIESNARLATQWGYRSRLYVLLDDETPAALRQLRKALPHVEVVDLSSGALFAEFKETKYAEAFEFFFSNDPSRRNLSAASDILRSFIQHRKGGLYLDTDDVLLQKFGRTPLAATADEVLTGGIASNDTLGMVAEFNADTFASHQGNRFFIDFLNEQADRFQLHRDRLTGRPHGSEQAEDTLAFVDYMRTISRTTAPGVFNDVLRRHSAGHAAFMDAVRDRVDIDSHPWLTRAWSLGGHSHGLEAEEAFAPLHGIVTAGNSHSWRQTR